MIGILGATQFDQCAMSMALIHLCNQDGHVGREVHKLYREWDEEADTSLNLARCDRHQFKIYIPHPEQEYDGMTLEDGLNQGFNIEVERVEPNSPIPYDLPKGAQLVIVLKQRGLNANFGIAATGIFIRPLAALKLDIIVDAMEENYQPILIRHPIIRDYASGWEQKLQLFLDRDIDSEALPNLVGYVDQSVNRDYRPPSWQEVRLIAKGFAGV
ncbi:MAG TPA: hypothetical protein V6D19_19470 [Stenomitos sp.]